MSDRIKPWHRKALERGRAPLPDAPGHCPWLRNDIDLDTSWPDESNGGPAVGLEWDHELRGVGRWFPQILLSKAHLTITKGSPATPLATQTVSI